MPNPTVDERGDLFARSTIQSISTKRLVGTIELWIDGTPDPLVAVAQGTYSRGNV